jgi:predicted nucleotidyltransferase
MVSGARPSALTDVQAAVDQVLRTVPEIAAGYVFGSVRGEALPESDLDVGVVYRETGVRELLVTSLASRIGAATGFERVDVVDPAGELRALFV